MQEPLIWIDLEMTGLDPERHVILEIASVLTDDSLNIIAEGPCMAVHPSAQALAAMDEWSREHHHLSGLLGRAQNSPYDHQAAEHLTLEFLSPHSRKGLSPLCGNSIWQDRRFLIKHMPELEAFFHYRNIDVSSLKELVRRWYPALPQFEKQKTHTALSDIKESIAELRYYREKVFV
jgi:oligoribonuclease